MQPRRLLKPVSGSAPSMWNRQAQVGLYAVRFCSGGRRVGQGRSTASIFEPVQAGAGLAPARVRAAVEAVE